MDFKFENNAGEKFNFFSDEQEKIKLQIKFENEILANFTLSKEEETNLIKEFLKHQIVNDKTETQILSLILVYKGYITQNDYKLSKPQLISKCLDYIDNY